MIHLFIADQGDEYEHIEVPKTTKKLARVAPVTWQRRLNNELVRTPKQFSVGLLEGLKHLPLAYRYHACVLCHFVSVIFRVSWGRCACRMWGFIREERRKGHQPFMDVFDPIKPLGALSGVPLGAVCSFHIP